MLTPGELQERIYNAANNYGDMDFNDVLNEIQSNYEMLYSRCVDFNTRIENLNSTIQYYMSIENTLKNALFLAEKVSEEKIEEASEKAKSIEKDALKKADDIVSDAKNELTTIRENITTLQVEYEKYLLEYRGLVKGQLEHLERDALALAEGKKSVTYALPDTQQEGKKVKPEIKFEKKPVDDKNDFPSKGDSSVFREASSEQLIIDADVTQDVDPFAQKSKSTDPFGTNVQTSVFGMNTTSTFYQDFGKKAENDAKVDSQILSDSIKNATLVVEDMVNTIENVSKDLDAAGAGLASAAKTIEDTTEIVITDEMIRQSNNMDMNQGYNDDNMNRGYNDDNMNRGYNQNDKSAYNNGNNYGYNNYNNYNQGYNNYQKNNMNYNNSSYDNYEADNNMNDNQSSIYDDIPQKNTYDYYSSSYRSRNQQEVETKPETKGGFLRRRKKQKDDSVDNSYNFMDPKSGRN